MSNHPSRMRPVSRTPGSSDAITRSRLLLTRQASRDMAFCATDYGHHLTPGLIIGQQWPSIFVVEGFAVEPTRRMGRSTDQSIFDRQTYDSGWSRGYDSAVQRLGQRQIGWWMHQEHPVNRTTGLTPMAIRGLFARSEWDALPRYDDLERAPVILVTWFEHRSLHLYAAELNQQTKEQRPMEMIWQGRHA